MNNSAVSLLISNAPVPNAHAAQAAKVLELLDVDAERACRPREQKHCWPGTALRC
jgi:hypothetical protein